MTGEELTKKLMMIADFYGFDSQMQKLSEELEELNDEVVNLKDEISNSEAVHLASEIADVKILIAQLEYLFEIEDLVEIAIDYKVNRQVKSIIQGE